MNEFEYFIPANCPKCGAPVPEKNWVCAYCRTRLISPPTQRSPIVKNPVRRYEEVSMSPSVSPSPTYSASASMSLPPLEIGSIVKVKASEEYLGYGDTEGVVLDIEEVYKNPSDKFVVKVKFNRTQEPVIEYFAVEELEVIG